MKLSREELLRQRALVKEQLRWLNAKLAESASETVASQPVSTPGTSPELPAELVQPIQVTTPETSGRTSWPKVDFAGDGSGEGVTTAQKIGCFVLVVFFCLGILGLLFVLPYLLY